MERQSKKQLLALIEKQDEQLKRYEARLRDVVQAYKGLQKEKIALEKSLKILSPGSKERLLENEPSTEQRRDSSEAGQVQSGQQVLNESDGTTTGASGDQSNDTTHVGGSDFETKDNGGVSSVANPQAQVQTLREALQTVMEQKSKMENSFQADRKNYLQELQLKEDAFAEERNEFSNEKKALQQEVQELRNRTRQEQQARESEQNDHVLMLKEMQLVVSKERLTKEELQSKLDRLNRSIASKESLNESPRGQDSGGNVAANVQDSTENLQSNSSPTLLQLQEEMIKMRTQLEKDILSEQLRANEAESKAQMIAKAEEQRVADLESKLSELSEVVGKYEKLRLHDQTEIQKLKDRIHEFNTLTTVVDNNDNTSDNRDVKNEMIVDNDANLHEILQKVKDILRSRAQDNDVIESELGGISKTELEYILKHDPAHKACQEELRQLKDEFECYKSEVQTIRTKTKQENEATSSDENPEKLRAQVSALRASLDSLQRDLDASESERRLDTEESTRELAELCAKHKVEIVNEQTVYSAKLQELESQVRNQRSRTLALVAEKDCEIERLQQKLGECSLSSNVRVTPRSYQKTSSSDNAVKELLSQTSPSPLVHYAQEQAFCEAELELLRKQRLEFEDTIRDITHREEQTADQVKLLKEEIRKLERNRSRENANLEYVKNVILRYLLTDSDSVRQQMVATIAQILEFSPKEIKYVCGNSPKKS